MKLKRASNLIQTHNMSISKLGSNSFTLNVNLNNENNKYASRSSLITK